ITDRGINSCNLALIPKNSIVMSSRAPIGHLAIAGCDLYTNQGCKSFVCDKSLDHEFLYFLLQHRMPEIQALGSGATFVEISKTILSNFEISFPVSVSKQRQIAAHLKAQLAEVEKASKATEMQLVDAAHLTTRYRENAMAKLNDTSRVPLGDLLLGIEAGKSFKTTELQARPDELGVLKVSAVSWNKFQPQEAKSIEGHYQPNERHRVQKGDLIISRANTIELVGAVVRVAENYPLRLLSDKTLRLVVNTDKVLPDYLLTLLKWSEARSHIVNNATGTSDSMRNISQKTINTIPVPLPSIDKQQNIIKLSNDFNDELIKIHQNTKQTLADLALLPQKILAQAFEI
ncbi:restriction endonuclease subunit S, partial [bacterium]|nr:restriction endonuclease subunit S [bacterium]